jgi:predicted RNA binding protein YcfA (HicA-like mRNA interferase family)
MKRRDLIKRFTDAGWYFLRQGGNHEIYTNGVDKEPISHQKEIKESVARAIIKRRGL